MISKIYLHLGIKNVMRVYLILTMLILIGCSDAEAPTTNQINEANKSDSLSESESNMVLGQEQQEFPMADTLIYTFFSNINEVQRFIDPEQGIYCLESGPGASPQMEKLLSKEDLMGKTPFLFLCRDIDFIKNQVYVNPQDFDFCNDETEGYFIFDLKEQQSVLEDVYKIAIAQEGSNANDTLLLDYRTIDRSLRKSVVVSFSNKHGEATLLKFYFTIKADRMVLSIIDLRECGV